MRILKSMDYVNVVFPLILIPESALSEKRAERVNEDEFGNRLKCNRARSHGGK
ncbi:hypothetical protein SAMN05444745_11118 [Arthrobacter sp. OV608]|nr:hypothetical protein SAMN05444745_11118 [Arthrobacter sp. OV608]